MKNRPQTAKAKRMKFSATKAEFSYKKINTGAARQVHAHYAEYLTMGAKFSAFASSAYCA